MTRQEYENEIKELKERIEKLEAAKIEAEQPKRWKPRDGERYILIKSNGEICWQYWSNDDYDRVCYLIGNCFKTQEEAEEYRKQIEYTARYKNYIEEHSEPLDWNNEEQGKYYAEYWFDDGDIRVDGYSIIKYQGIIYASSEEIIWDAIKQIGEDNFKKYVLGVK